MEAVSNPIMTKMYQAGGMPGGPAGAPGGMPGGAGGAPGGMPGQGSSGAGAGNGGPTIEEVD